VTRITKHQYTGYLKPWLSFIHDSYSNGQGAKKIANAICKDIVKHPEKLTDPYHIRYGLSPEPCSAMVHYVLERTYPGYVKARGQVISAYPTEPRWRAILGPELANAQGRWERTRAMLNMYRAGFSLAEVGQRFGISRERVRQLITHHCRLSAKKQLSPLERYLHDDTPLWEFASACGVSVPVTIRSNSHYRDR
jgi:predicted DNA-binding protein YlxM (UPF0122 family)